MRLVRERADIVPLLTEVFRTHGYEGASLALIGKATGLGKGSLYNFFPGGKEEMAAAVLGHIDAWFHSNIFESLGGDGDAIAAIDAMFEATDSYFHSGGRVCIVGVFALGEARDLFAERINGYFAAWREALALALTRAGRDIGQAGERAEQVVADIQGALVLARALNDPNLFRRRIARLRADLLGER